MAPDDAIGTLRSLSQNLLACVECSICMDVMKEVASGYCGHSFCIGCIGCSMSSSFACPVCREPIQDLVRNFNVEHLAAVMPACARTIDEVIAFIGQLECQLRDANARIAELEEQCSQPAAAAAEALHRANGRIAELEGRADERLADLQGRASARIAELEEQCQRSDSLLADLLSSREQQRVVEGDHELLQKEYCALQEEVRRLQESGVAADDGAREHANVLEQALVNVMQHTHGLSRAAFAPKAGSFCPSSTKSEVWRELGVSLFGGVGATLAVAEFGVVRDCLEDAGQECMGNMSLGISSDGRFKIEYYGSSRHVFSELEVEGTVHADGQRLLFAGVRSGSSNEYSGGNLGTDETDQEALPAIHGLVCSQGRTTWIVLFDFSARVRVPIFNSADIILLMNPQQHFMGYQPLSW